MLQKLVSIVASEVQTHSATPSNPPGKRVNFIDHEGIPRHHVEHLQKYLDEGWKIVSVTTSGGGGDSADFCVFVLLEKEDDE